MRKRNNTRWAKKRWRASDLDTGWAWLSAINGKRHREANHNATFSQIQKRARGRTAQSRTRRDAIMKAPGDALGYLFRHGFKLEYVYPAHLFHVGNPHVRLRYPGIGIFEARGDCLHCSFHGQGADWTKLYITESGNGISGIEAARIIHRFAVKRRREKKNKLAFPG